MGLVLRQTATVAAATEAVEGGTLAVDVPTFGAASAAFACQISPKEPASIYEDYGIELKRPAVLICGLGQLALFAVGNRVQVGTRVYAVQAAPQSWANGLSTDHVTVLLEELEFAV